MVTHPSSFSGYKLLLFLFSPTSYLSQWQILRLHLQNRSRTPPFLTAILVPQNVARKGSAEGVASAVVPRAVLGDYLGGVSLKTPTIYSAENGSPKF